MIYIENPLWMLGVWSPIIALGAVLAFFTFRAWSKTPTRAMFALGLGFLLLSVGPGATWCGIFYWTDDAIAAAIATVVVMAGGFLSLLYSIRTRFN